MRGRGIPVPGSILQTATAGLALLAFVVSSCEAQPQATRTSIWLIAASQPWTPPGRVAVLASPDGITQRSPSVRRATITLVYESSPGGARSTVAIVEEDCARNSQNLITMSNFAEDGSPLPSPGGANSSNSPNTPSAIGTRINHAICTDPHQWGTAVPAEEAPRGETAVSFAIAIFSGRHDAPASITTATVPPPAESNSLVPPRNGQVACYWGIPETKRCRTIERYEFQSADTLVVHATVAQDPARHTAMVVSYRARIRDNAVCGGPDENDGRAATLWIDGQEANATQTAEFRDQFAQRLPLIAAEGEHCVRFSQFPYGVWAQVTMGGRHSPVQDAPISWVSPDAGFEVRP